jgi:hypothetical protein
MNWFYSFLTWTDGLDPTSFGVFIVAPPLLVAGLVASYFKWRDDHRPHDPHAAE